MQARATVSSCRFAPLHDVVRGVVCRTQACSTVCLFWRRLSPLSQKVTLREVREGAGRSLAHSLRMEFRQVLPPRSAVIIADRGAHARFTALLFRPGDLAARLRDDARNRP